MRYQVPQFIEVEDKIIGPLTFVQFIYLVGGLGFMLGCYLLTNSYIVAIILGGPFAVLGLGLAFYRVNDRPLIDVLEHAITFYLNSRDYRWNKVEQNPSDIAKQKALQQIDHNQFIPAATSNKIKDLAWSLDIKESMYSTRDQK